MSLTLEQHLFGNHPKRILALDGGGIRGILTLQILKRIELLLQSRHGQDTRLSDYYDLIGGTSTGSIIAAALALGWEVDKINSIYKKLGGSIFESSFFRRGLLNAKFDSGILTEQLEREFGDIKLGGSELKTGLAVMLKRLDTGSPWIVHNNPRGKYYHQRPGSDATPNSDFLLRQIVRASTAAPTYFDPELLAVADDQNGAFVDGGVSPHNNPALQLLMLATLKGYGLNWPTGENNLLITSVGTGRSDLHLSPEKVMSAKAAKLGIQSLASLMGDASALNETLLQWLSASPTARQIDREVGDLSTDMLGAAAPMLTYLRYEAWLEVDWLKENLGITSSNKELESLAKMDKPENMDRLIEIGTACGAHLVEDTHFPSVFDG